MKAKPFLSDLIPALGTAIDTIPDPEARDVATKTHEFLVGLDKKAIELGRSMEFKSLIT